MSTKRERNAAAALLGAKGGRTRGPSKRRGDSAYYKALSAKALAKRYGKGAQ